MQLIIGSYTEELPYVQGKADGIGTAVFDPASGRIGPVGTAAVTRNPSYLTASASGERLYAVNETLVFAGQRGGGITAYARDQLTGGLTELNTGPSLGEAPCHVVLDRTERFVLVANYGIDAGSVTVYRLEPDGRLGAVTDHVQHAGSGPDPDRQATSHAHMIANDPVTGNILVADLGSDAVLVYAFDSAGRLTLKAGCCVPAAPGAGPRHLVFHPDGQHLFVVNELSSTVCALRREGDRFAVTDHVSTLPADPGRDNLASAIRVTASGRHLLVSNRGHDSLAVLRFDPATATLSLAGSAPTGTFPRDLTITPDGRYVVVAAQDSDLVASYGFDDSDGTLRLLHTAAAPTPVCLTFV